MQTHDLDEQQASERARARLVEILQHSGLALDRLSLRPVRGPRVPNSYQEVGWLLAIRGKVDAIVNCLYLLQHDPFLSRLDNLTLAPVARSDEIELRLRYATLVLLYPKDEKPVDPQKDAPPRPLAPLQNEDRQAYGLVAARDLFRPYVPRAPRQEWAGPTNDAPVSSDGSGDHLLRVVGLPSWGGAPEVILHDLASGQTRQLHIGDELAGGRIVLIDYRSMPMPGNPDILSTSRVIVRIEQAYWAIELGQPLSERRRLEQDQLPPQLAQAAPTDGQP